MWLVGFVLMDGLVCLEMLEVNEGRCGSELLIIEGMYEE